LIEKHLKRAQNTLKRKASYAGIGVHTGKEVSLTLHPAKAGTGLLFRRIDLPNQPEIPATLEYVQSTPRSTNIGIGDVTIHTVEHLLAALKAYKVDNLIIDISGIEVPIANGSSDVFVKLIEQAGIKEQSETKPIITLTHPLYWTSQDIHLIALPSDSYRVSYTLHYPTNKALGCQYFSFVVTAENFKQQVASCRTFSLYEEISVLLEKGLIKGGSLDNAVVIKDGAFLSKEGLKFPDEAARHKALDLIGDLSLIGFDFFAHIVAIKSGHPSNFQLAKTIFNYIATMENQ
jgi:UDP-3-O-[3-hydroxymyristoyl] N-acetylglucosamine deacetylase